MLEYLNKTRALCHLNLSSTLVPVLLFALSLSPVCPSKLKDGSYKTSPGMENNAFSELFKGCVVFPEHVDPLYAKVSAQ